jgi:hypothetical protein
MSKSLLTGHRVYVLGGNHAIEKIFQLAGATKVFNLSDSDIVVWTGGPDVSPELYGEAKHPRTYCDPRRDAWEAACFKRANERLKIGICRGGQFLNVMNGGTLWQDVDNHGIRGEHLAYYKDVTGQAQTFRVTSTHHQQIIPKIQSGAEVWGWAGLTTKKTCGLKDAKTGEWLSFKMNEGHSSDCEICWYPKTRSLCFQPHPEYMSQSTHELFFTCIERALAA